MQLCGAAAHVQPAGERAFVLEAVVDALLHGFPELVQAGADLFLAAPDLLVGHHQLRHAEVVLLAQAQQFGGAVEVVRQHRLVGIQHAAGGLGGIDHEAATHRVVGVAVQLALLAFGNQGHRVGVVRQVLVQQQHVAGPDEFDGQAAVQLQGVGFAQVGDTRCDLGRVDGVRPFTHQAHDGGIVGAMPHTRGRQRAIQAHFDPLHTFQLAAFAQALDEQGASTHGADGVGAGGPDTDLEQVEHADGHCRITSCWACLCAPCAGRGSC
ncbi:hypothetical protein D3C85_1085820 [compost metagenome]